MHRKLRVGAIAWLGAAVLACQIAPPAALRPADSAPESVAAKLAAANEAVRENEIPRGVALYDEAARDPGASDLQRAEALYNIALLGLASETRVRDLPLSLRRLRALRSRYPHYNPREVNAMILLTSSLIDTRADLARQREALKSVTDAVIRD